MSERLRRVRRTIAAVLPLVVCSAIAIFAQDAEAKPVNGGGITTGALYGLIATWVGFLVAFMNLRRGMKADAERFIEQAAARITKEEIDERAPHYITRAEHERAERAADERYASLLRRLERLEDDRLKR